MKAIVQDRYGSAEVLSLRDIDKPTLDDDSVLVRVRSTSLNAVDWHLMTGLPYVARLSEGLRKPRNAVPGIDVAGVVEAVGRDVTQLKPGDEVFGARGGAFAEYVRGRERNFVPKSARLTFEQAAAIPTAAVTALQALRDKGVVQPGQRVLITGAGGGVGSFAVQIAKAFGAEVTAVTSTSNVEMVRSIGADHVIDRTHEDFTRMGQRHDLILDISGDKPLSACRRALTPRGRLVVVGIGASAAPTGNWLGPLMRPLQAIVLSRFGKQRLLPFLAKHSRDNLMALKQLADDGRITPVIDRVYPLNELPDAMRYFEGGGAHGKVVISV
jgi:NADPH:quinone reductase-like Zn-dependent oxidoreductase